MNENCRKKSVSKDVGYQFKSKAEDNTIAN